MRTKADSQPLTPPARTYAQLEFTHAAAFCTWLADHGQHPATLAQVELDRYYTALKIGHRQSLRGFLNWSITSQNLPKLSFARPRFTTGEALTQSDRVALLRRFVTDDDSTANADSPLRTRVAACIMLLYAQPVTRIMTITIDDIVVDDDRAVFLRLGDPPTPVPEPFAALILRLRAHHPVHSSNHWLFPGRSPRIPPHHHPPPDHQRRRNLESLRRARPAHSTSRPANTRQMNTRRCQYKGQRSDHVVGLLEPDATGPRRRRRRTGSRF
jgi:hypothetical protein